MKIGIDIDDVVVEFVKGFCEFFNKLKNTNYVFEDVYTYNLKKLVNISKEEEINLIKDFNKSEKFFNLDFVKGAKENIFDLEEKNKIFFITSRPLEIEKITNDFFERNFPKNNFEIHFSCEKWGNGEGKTKGEICLDLGIEVIIEDNEKFALECAEKGIKSFLLDKPWNQDYVKHENIIKVKNWKELMVHLNEILKEENAN
jgi:uncharacterized HAD superfamily protein